MSSPLPPLPLVTKGGPRGKFSSWKLESFVVNWGVLKTKKLQASPDMRVAPTTQKGTPQLSPSDIDFTKTAACETDPKK